MDKGHFDSLDWGQIDDPSKVPNIPQAPPPDNQSPVQEARFLLRAVAEVEHALLTQYLYAAYSAKLPGARAKLVQIAKEEMGHLLCVQNLLMAVGTRPYFDRKNYPISTDNPTFYPYAFTLEPLSLNSLAKYVTTESPFPEMIDDPALKSRLTTVIGTGKAAAGSVINHVGALFIALYWMFKVDDTAPTELEWSKFPTQTVLAILKKMNKPNWHVKDEDFATAAEVNAWQADEPEWGGTAAIFVRPVAPPGGKVDRSLILKTLADIAAQGEAWTMSTNSHFDRFLALWEQAQALPAGTAVAFDVPTHPSSAPPPAGQPVPPNSITGDEALRWARLFNTRYQMVLLQLTLAVTLPKTLVGGAANPTRTALIDRVVHTEMPVNLRTMAGQLIRLRRQGPPAAAPSTVVAAPPFEMPREALPDREPSIWLRLRDLVAETKAICQEIVGLPPDPGNPSDRSIAQQFLDPAASPDADLVQLIDAAIPPGP